MKKKHLIIFDIDGVLFNSLKNMRVTWKKVNKKYNLNIPFTSYKNFIGYPFKDILKKLGIKKNFSLIENDYKKFSEKKIVLIRPYNNVLKKIKFLKEKNILLGVCTSKDKKRTGLILKKYGLFFDFIECNKKGVKGKPNPNQLLKIINSSGVSIKRALYIGDMLVDSKTASRAKVDFVFAQWGYGHNKNYKYKIKSIKDIKKFI